MPLPSVNPTSKVNTEATVNDGAIQADKATCDAFKGIAAHVPPADAPAALFDIGECVCVQNSTTQTHGGMIEAVAWKDEYESYIYKIDKKRISHKIFKEDEVKASQYIEGDVVNVRAFGFISRRVIQGVSVNEDGEFYYDIVSDFQIRDEDISGLVGRGASLEDET